MLKIGECYKTIDTIMLSKYPIPSLMSDVVFNNNIGTIFTVMDDKSLLEGKYKFYNYQILIDNNIFWFSFQESSIVCHNLWNTIIKI